MNEHGATEWRVTGRPMVRIGLLRLPAIDDPDLSSSNVRTWVEWLGRVWHSPGFAEAISHASTDLDRSVTMLLAADPDRVDVKKARKTVRAVLGYVVRSRERTTPFGLIAGVASGNFAAPCRAQFGEDHRYFVQPGGAWVREIVDQMIAWPEVRSSTGVVAAHSVVLQGNEVVVPQHGRPDHARSGEAHIKATPEVLHVLERAHHPVRWDALVESVCSLHPDAPVQEAEDMVLQMVRAGALMTDLSPPQSKTDPLRHLARKTCAAACTARIGQAADLLAACNGAGAPRERMYEVSKELVSITGAQSIGVDALADAQVDLPSSVARAAEHAAHLLTALSAHPGGLPAWEGYRERFVDRYHDSLVPVRELLHPDHGLGFPPGYGVSARNTITERDRHLLTLAQDAALRGAQEVVLDDQLLQDLISGTRSAPPDHTELHLRVYSPSPAVLDSGRFGLAVLGASRGMYTMAGRFLGLTSQCTDARRAFHRAGQVLPVQLSFPPKRASDTHVTRTLQVLEQVLHVDEYPSTTEALTPDDLHVGDDGEELFLWSHRLQRRIEPVVPHSLNWVHAPAMARFLAELPRSGRTVLTGFDWGLAHGLPYVPRLRSGRFVLSPARWRVRAVDLPRPGRPWHEWKKAWQSWSRVRGLPRDVELGAGDQRLLLDLEHPGHLHLLRSHLRAQSRAVLTEAPPENSHGWSHGHPVDILLQLVRRGTA